MANKQAPPTIARQQVSTWSRALGWVLPLYILSYGHSPAVVALEHCDPESSAIVARVEDPILKRGIKRLCAGRISEQDPHVLLELALKQQDAVLAQETTSLLLRLLEASRWQVDAHRLMVYALKHARPAVVRYLFEANRYDPRSLAGSVPYNLAFRLPLIRLLALEVMHAKHLPIPIMIGLIFSWFHGLNMLYQLLAIVGIASSQELHKVLWALFKAQTLISIIQKIATGCYVVYLGSQVGRSPSYLAIVIEHRKSATDVEELVRLLLEKGADPTAEYLVIRNKKQVNVDVVPLSIAPRSYRFYTPLHRAVERKMYKVAKILLAHGATVNAVAMLCEDALPAKGEGEDYDQLITLRTLAYRDGTNCQYKTPIDLVPKYSRMYSLLKQQGGSSYKHIVASKKKGVKGSE